MLFPKYTPFIHCWPGKGERCFHIIIHCTELVSFSKQGLQSSSVKGFYRDIGWYAELRRAERWQGRNVVEADGKDTGDLGRGENTHENRHRKKSRNYEKSCQSTEQPESQYYINKRNYRAKRAWKNRVLILWSKSSLKTGVVIAQVMCYKTSNNNDDKVYCNRINKQTCGFVLLFLLFFVCLLVFVLSAAPWSHLSFEKLAWSWLIFMPNCCFYSLTHETYQFQDSTQRLGLQI